MKKVILTITTLALILSLYQVKNKTSLAKITSNDDYDFISINQIKMWLGNNGSTSYNPNNYSSGLYWPGGTWNGVIYEDGIVWGGIAYQDGKRLDTLAIRVGGSTYRHGLQAGPILPNGLAADPADPRYRVYKVRPDWQDYSPGDFHDQLQKDYEQWPWQDGAPWIDVDGDGIYTPYIDHPDWLGDEMLWYVANDFDSTRTLRLHGSPPIGLEQQMTVFAFNRIKDIGNILFKKYSLINKGIYLIDSFYVGQYSDVDMGEFQDDFVGCDTLLDIAYVWNSDNDDAVYGIPPAAGYVFLNRQMSTFVFYINPNGTYALPSLGLYSGTIELYNNLQGKLWNGAPLINLLTGDTVKLSLSGDPVSGTGWYEGLDDWPRYPSPDNRYLLAGIGPFTFNPGDTLDIWMAFVIGLGEDRFDSITEMRKTATIAKRLYENNFRFDQKPLAPKVEQVPADRAVTLYWDEQAEQYSKPVLYYPESSYNFEGYFVWQYKDFDSDERRLIAIYDLKNNIDKLSDYVSFNDIRSEVNRYLLPNNGINHKINIQTDAFSEDTLYNGSEYYFAVTAIAYSDSADPKIIESTAEILTIRPGAQTIDTQNPYQDQDLIAARQISGLGDGIVTYRVVNPDALKNKSYRVVFTGNRDSVLSSVIDLSNNDTLSFFKDKPIPQQDSSFVFDGISLIIANPGYDSLQGFQFGIKRIEEIKGAAGTDLDNPIDVIKNYNSTGAWTITSPYIGDPRIYINFRDYIGTETYEIRFTGQGSEYYLTGGLPGNPVNDPFHDDSKANGRVPFEVWTLGEDPVSTNDDQRLIIKIRDDNHLNPEATITDGQWTRFPADDPYRPGEWEQIFAYYPLDSVYMEPLPEQSGRTAPPISLHKFGRFIIKGELPAQGTVIRISTWRPLSEDDVFEFTVSAPDTQAYSYAKQNLDKISVFPNPYFGSALRNGQPGQGFVRLMNLPRKVTLRVYTIAGVFINKIEKDDPSPWLDWNLRSVSGKEVASGIYLLHLEMPNIGSKVLKLAVIQDNK